jgi:hypothetical protein
MLNTSTIINNTINIKNSNLAISANATAIPVKPNKPAMIAIIKNTIAQYNMAILLI